MARLPPLHRAVAIAIAFVFAFVYLALRGMGMLSLTSRWFIAPGREDAADEALRALATSIEAGEPDTLAYLVHRPLFVGVAGKPYTTVDFLRRAAGFIRPAACGGYRFAMFTDPEGNPVGLIAPFAR